MTQTVTPPPDAQENEQLVDSWEDTPDRAHVAFAIVFVGTVVLASAGVLFLIFG